MLRFDAVTVFPAMFDAVTQYGVSARALNNAIWQFAAWNPRDFTADAYRRVDDRPFGGGPGMVMLAEPLAAAIRAAQAAGPGSSRVLLMSPQGRRLDQAYARQLRQQAGQVVLVCGRYEGIDERLIDSMIDDEVSVGDVVLSGGEIAAMALIDAVVRLLPGALNDTESAEQDSFADGQPGGLLDCPHYTRPEIWNSVPVPEVLASGHHGNIARWRREQALRATAIKRPDLIDVARRAGQLSAADELFLQRFESSKLV